MSDKPKNGPADIDLVESYLVGDTKISTLYDKTKHETVPVELASKVLANVESGPDALKNSFDKYGSKNWYIPFGLAAAIALSVSLMYVDSEMNDKTVTHIATNETQPVLDPSNGIPSQEPVPGTANPSSIASIEPDKTKLLEPRDAQYQNKSSNQSERPQSITDVSKGSDLTLNNSLMKESNSENLEVLAKKLPSLPKITSQDSTIPEELTDLVQTVGDGAVPPGAAIVSPGVTENTLNEVATVSATESSVSDMLSDLMQPLSDIQSSETQKNPSARDMLQPLSKSNSAVNYGNSRQQLSKKQWLDKIIRLYQEGEIKEARDASEEFVNLYPEFPLQKYLAENLDLKNIKQ